MKKEISVTLMQDLPSERIVNLVQEANDFHSYILIHADRLQINVKNPFSMMLLREIGSRKIVINAIGLDSELALERLTSLLAVH